MNKEEIIRKVEKRVEKEIQGIYDPDMLGYIHVFEARKKEILKNEYGMDFKTLREVDMGESID